MEIHSSQLAVMKSPFAVKMSSTYSHILIAHAQISPWRSAHLMCQNVFIWRIEFDSVGVLLSQMTQKELMGLKYWIQFHCIFTNSVDG